MRNRLRPKGDSRVPSENVDRRISFTWGGGRLFSVFLRMVPSLSAVYEPLIYSLESHREAQLVAQRGNQALKHWAPHLLRDDAELPGIGFQYPYPEVREDERFKGPHILSDRQGHTARCCGNSSGCKWCADDEDHIKYMLMRESQDAQGRA
jgi:hypothetical protein